MSTDFGNALINNQGDNQQLLETAENNRYVHIRDNQGNILFSVDREQSTFRALSLPPVDGCVQVRPRVHLKKAVAAISTGPVIVFIGDSTNTGNNTFTPFTPVVGSVAGSTGMVAAESIVETLKRAIRRQNPGVSMQFYNFAIGGQGWLQLANGPATGPVPAWYTDPAAAWLSYPEAVQPDTVIIQLGGNDGNGLSANTVVTALTTICGWAKVPDIILITPWFSNPIVNPLITTLGMKGGAVLLRGLVESGFRYITIPNLPRVGLIDVGRYQRRVVEGMDYGNQALRIAITDLAMPTGGNYNLPQTPGDFMLDVLWPNIAGASSMPSGIFYYGTHAGLYVFTWSATTTGMTVVVYNGSASAYPSGTFASGDVSTGNAGQSDFDMRVVIAIKNNNLTVMINNCIFVDEILATFGADNVPQLVVTGGKRLNPYTVKRVALGVPAGSTKALDYQTMVGKIFGPIGGNGGAVPGDNHPSSYGERDIYGNIYDAANWCLEDGV